MTHCPLSGQWLNAKLSLMFLVSAAPALPLGRNSVVRQATLAAPTDAKGLNLALLEAGRLQRVTSGAVAL
jgi:hypothetical protein